MRKVLENWLMHSFLLLTLMIGITASWSMEAKAEEKPNLAILPFFVERIENPGRRAVTCPLCKGLYQSGEIVPGSQYMLTRLLYTKIEGLDRFRILPLEKGEEVLTATTKKQFEEKPIPTAIQIGKELNADFIWVGFLFRFEDRIGSAIGATKPASVGFDVHLFRIRDGAEVWKGGIDETQRPLSENLFQIGSFLRRKASWLTAEELAGVGMEELLKRLPGVKELEEKK